MKTFRFGCPFCAQSLEVENSKRGDAIICPSCNRAVAIPRKRPRAFAYFITAAIGLVIVAAFAAAVMIIYILRFQPGTGSAARPFTTDVAALSPLDQLKYHAKRGDADSQYCLGVKYFKGEGVRRDVGEAIKWFKKAADAGLVQSQAALGYIYFTGEDTSKNTKESAKWLKLAADRGDASSQSLLGVLYETGDGVAKDNDKALDFYAAAFGQGDQTAWENWVRLTKTMLNNKLNSYENGQFIPQAWFDAIHPVGKAKSISVDRISFDEQNNEILVLSLLWEGPITVNGCTQIQVSVDGQGVTDFKILSTNGITKNDLSNAATDFFGGFFGANL